MKFHLMDRVSGLGAQASGESRGGRQKKMDDGSSLEMEPKKRRILVDEGCNERENGEQWANDLLNSGIFGPNSEEEKYKALMRTFHETPRALDVVRQNNGFVGAAIEKHKPDLIWFDSAYILPCVYYSGVPWVLNMSMVPVIYLSNVTDEVPPDGSGKWAWSPSEWREQGRQAKKNGRWL